MTNPRLYSVSVGGGAGRQGHAPNLAKAKTLGTKLARLTERNDVKWNLSYVAVIIYKQDSPGSYKPTGWRMMIPVRGTGARREQTVANIKRRFGVPPYTWFLRR